MGAIFRELLAIHIWQEHLNDHDSCAGARQEFAAQPHAMVKKAVEQSMPALFGSLPHDRRQCLSQMVAANIDQRRSVGLVTFCSGTDDVACTIEDVLLPCNMY